MINIRRLTATTHSQRCTLCARWMLVLCMECETECDCEVDE